MTKLIAETAWHHEGDYIFEQIAECIEDEINRITLTSVN